MDFGLRIADFGLVLLTSIFDHPIIIFVIIVVTMLRWLSQRPKTPTDDPERPKVPDKPIPRTGDAQSEEERIRRFLEALGQPTRSTPPPKVTRRTTFPKREVSPRARPFGSPLPPLTTAPPSVTKPSPLPTFPVGPVQVFPPPPPPPTPPVPVKEQVISPTSETTYEVRDLEAQPPGESVRPSQPSRSEQRSFILKLGSAQDLRRAIILREILGPPRGLRTNESF